MTHSLYDEVDNKLPTARDVLSEIQAIILEGGRTSTNAARKFYSTRQLPELLNGYFLRRRFKTQTQAATFLEMSTTTVQKIINGSDISENMLFRLSVAFKREVLITDVGEKSALGIMRFSLRSTSGSSTQSKISTITQTLSSLISDIKASTSLGDTKSAISELECAQLLAVLETAIASLRAPIVNVEETASAIGWFKRIFRKSAEKELEGKIRTGLENAISEGQDLVGELVKNEGISDIGSFFS